MGNARRSPVGRKLIVTAERRERLRQTAKRPSQVPLTAGEKAAQLRRALAIAWLADQVELAAAELQALPAAPEVAERRRLLLARFRGLAAGLGVDLGVVGGEAAAWLMEGH